MKPEDSSLAEILRFQQSLLNLVSQDETVRPEVQGPASEQARQLEAWARQVRPEAG
jgi:hypothetical protein